MRVCTMILDLPLLVEDSGCSIYLCFESSPSNVLLCILDEKALEYLVSDAGMNEDVNTYLYHHTVGPTVPKCHRLCASSMPQSGGKSNSSKLMASIIQATIMPGHAAHGFLSS